MNAAYRARGARATDPAFSTARHTRHLKLTAELRRPFLILAMTTLVCVVWIVSAGRTLDQTFAYAVLQYFAILGPVALAFGLAMIASQFDLSVSALFVFSGIVAVQFASSSWITGLVAAIAVGAAIGVMMGSAIVLLRAPSLPVTLGGLVTLSGLSYVVTGNTTLTMSDFSVGANISKPMAQVFSIQSLLAISFFAAASLFMHLTRPGRDLYATGNNRPAAKSVGIRVGVLTVGVLSVGSMLTAFSGSLTAFTLASASPTNPTDVLIPAAVAAIMGGISVSGGAGSPLGIMAGVLTLSVINTSFNVLATPTFLTQVVYGAFLLAAMVAGAQDKSKLSRLVRRGVKRNGSSMFALRANAPGESASNPDNRVTPT